MDLAEKIFNLIVLYDGVAPSEHMKAVDLEVSWDNGISA